MKGELQGLPDKSLRKGILSFIILNYLSSKPGYPYAILKKLMKIKHPMLQGLSKSDLYNIINSFEKNGLVKGRVVIKGSRVQKFYELTAKGRTRLKTSRKIMFETLSQIRSLMKVG